MNSSRRIFQVHCPSCLTEFPIDSAKLPEKGVAAICSVCLRVFPVYHPQSDGHYGGVDDFIPAASAASAVAVEDEVVDLEIGIPETEGESELSEEPVLEEFEVVSEWPGDDQPVAIDGEAAEVDDRTAGVEWAEEEFEEEEIDLPPALEEVPEPSADEEETFTDAESEAPGSPPGTEEPEVAAEIDGREPVEDADHPFEVTEDSFAELSEDSNLGLEGSSGDIATESEPDDSTLEVPDEVLQEPEWEVEAAQVAEEEPITLDAEEALDEEPISLDVDEVVPEDAADEGIPDTVVEEVTSESVIEEVEAEDRAVEGSVEAPVDPEPEVVEAFEPPESPAPPAPEKPAFEDLSSFTNEVLAEAESTFPPPVEKVRPAPEKVERFGRRDPHERARHLARVLVSDIIAYYPVRYQESLARRTLPEDFADEIQKSYREYVDQVGSEMAESTPYFVDALNHVLGRGEKFF